MPARPLKQGLLAQAREGSQSHVLMIVLDVRLICAYDAGMASKRKLRISDQLRDAILNSQKTRYRIAKETGLSEAALSRFANGVMGLSMDSIDKIGECLGLEIRERPKKPKGQ